MHAGTSPICCQCYQMCDSMTTSDIYAFPTDHLSGGAARPWACGGACPAVCASTHRWAPVPTGGRQYPPVGARTPPAGTRTRLSTPLQPLLCTASAPRRRERTPGPKQCRNECTVVDIARMPQVGGAIDGAGGGAGGGAVSWAAHRRMVNLPRTASPPTESSHR